MSSTAVCLLSGGLDSATALYVAMRECEKVYALTIHYGQLHEREIQSAHKITKKLSIPHEVIEISMPWKGSALLDSKISLPKNRESNEMALGIPATYVPARNTVVTRIAGRNILSSLKKRSHSEPNAVQKAAGLKSKPLSFC